MKKFLSIVTVALALAIVPAVTAEANTAPTPKTVVHRPCPPVFHF